MKHHETLECPRIVGSNTTSTCFPQIAPPRVVVLCLDRLFKDLPARNLWICVGSWEEVEDGGSLREVFESNLMQFDVFLRVTKSWFKEPRGPPVALVQ